MTGGTGAANANDVKCFVILGRKHQRHATNK